LKPESIVIHRGLKGVLEFIGEPEKISTLIPNFRWDKPLSFSNRYRTYFTLALDLSTDHYYIKPSFGGCLKSAKKNCVL
jgi:hypothetical protein